MENSSNSRLFSFSNRGGALVSALIIFYLMKPYFIWNGILNTPQVLSLLTFFLGVLFFLQRQKGDKELTVLLILFLAITVSYTFINHYNFFFSLTFLPVCFLPFAKERYSREVYNNFLNIYTIIMAISLIVWILVLIGGMPSTGSIAPLNKLKNYRYIVYPFLVRAPNSYRFFSIFDEPGVVGTVSGLIICIQKFNLRDWRNLIVFISGLCSLSFFFYLLIAAYFLLYNVFIKRSTKNIIIYFFCVLVVFYIITSVESLNEILGFRFEWDASSGTFAGDNRLGEKGIDLYESIKGTDQFWWGVDDKDGYLELVSGSSSFLNVIVINGMFFAIAYLSFWILYGMKVKETKGTFVLFGLCFFATIYQRPFLFSSYFIFLWVCLITIKTNVKLLENYE